MALLDKEQPWFQTLEECRECSSDSNSYGRAMWSKRSQAVMYFLLDGLHFMMHVVAPYMPVPSWCYASSISCRGSFIAKGGKSTYFPFPVDVNINDSAMSLNHEWMPRATEREEFMWALPNFCQLWVICVCPCPCGHSTNVIPYRQGCKENTLTFLDLFDVLVKCKEQKYEFTQTHETCAIDIEPITITRK